VSHVTRNPPTSMRLLFRVVTDFPLLQRHAVVAGSALSGTLYYKANETVEDEIGVHVAVRGKVKHAQGRPSLWPSSQL
jgi:hypothetical protein